MSQFDLDLDASYSASFTAITGPPVSLKDIEAGLEKAKKLLEEAHKISSIKIWKGDNTNRLFSDIKLRPELHYSEYVPDDHLFLWAGIGIVAGAKAFAFIRRMGVMLQWSDEFIELEDQESEAAKILAKYEIKRIKI